MSMRLEHWFYIIPLRLRSLLQRQMVEQELDEELQYHLERRMEEGVTRGLAPDEARRAALRAMEGLAQRKEECRDTRRVNLIEDFARDLLYAIRVLRKSPAFTAVALASLAFGIGVNTAVFSLIDTLLMREVNVADPDSLVSVRRALARGGTSSQFSPPIFEQLRDHNHAFSAAIGWTSSHMAVKVGDGPADIVNVRFASGNYYSVLGVHALMGRTFTPEDDKPGAGPVVVISYQYWQARFSGSSSVLNQTIDAKGIPFKIVGVSPPGFIGLSVRGIAMDISLPLAWYPRFKLNDDSVHANVTGRLRPGVTIEQARADLNVIFARVLSGSFEPGVSAERKKELLSQSIEVVPIGRGDREDWARYKLRLTVLMGAAGIVLLIACANIANLLLARASARQKEIAVRLAIGSGRGRLIRQLLTESILLAVLGGSLGLWFAIWAHRALSWLLRFVGDFAIDWRVLAFASGLSLLAGVLFGLAPALRSTRVDLIPSLKERSSQTGSARYGLGKALVVFQVALSLLLMIGAGLLVHSFRNLNHVDPGFDAENVLLFGIYPTTVGYEGSAEIRLYEEYLRRFNQVPGVVSASMSRHELMQGGGHFLKVTAAGGEATANVNAVAPGFLATMRIPLLAGRDFSTNDTQQGARVAIVDETFARNHFGLVNPLGKRLAIGEPGSSEIEIVGVMRPTRYYAVRQYSSVPSEQVFLPFTQAPLDMLGQMCFAVRTAASPLSFLGAIRSVAQQVEKNLPVVFAMTQVEEVQDSIREERSLAVLTSLFGALAVLLASIGLYGVMSYTVARRIGEIGIRMVLGAARRDVYWLVLRESTLLVVAGVALGIPAALAATRYLKSILYEIEPSDAATFLIGALLLAAIAMLAAYLPARRATRIDPMVALRYE